MNKHVPSKPEDASAKIDAMITDIVDIAFSHNIDDRNILVRLERALFRERRERLFAKSRICVIP